jgi:hypothetical protein
LKETLVRRSKFVVRKKKFEPVESSNALAVRFAKTEGGPGEKHM